jgi:cation transporter-like permease
MRIYASLLLAFILLATVGAAQTCELTNVEHDVYRTIFDKASPIPVISAVPERIAGSVFDGLSNHLLRV